ncbi:MAG: DUF5615 family PIN-like protein [Nitrospirota bacterium]
MPLRFFADHCVSNFIVKTLRDAGHEVFLLKEHIPADSPDPLVISNAQELDFILISLNGDFSDIVTYPSVNYKGIIALQIKNHPEITVQLITRVKRYLSAHPDMVLYQGKLFLVEVHRIRIRE